MCYGINIIVRQGQRKADWDELNLGHAEFAAKMGLKDDKFIDRKLVRLEAWPLGELTSTRRKDWQIKVDEKETLPEWFSEDSEKWFELAFKRVLRFVRLAVQGKFGGSLGLRGTGVTSLGDCKVTGNIYK